MKVSRDWNGATVQHEWHMIKSECQYEDTCGQSEEDMTKIRWVLKYT